MPGDREIMLSFALEEVVGNGALHEKMNSLVADGWADAPTPNAMGKEEMNILGLTLQQQDALEIRTYFHDRMLMIYADTLEASGKTLSELLSTSPTQLTTQHKMRRGHVARFLNQGSACAIKVPGNLVLPVWKVAVAHHGGAILENDHDDEPSPRVAVDSPKSKCNSDINSFGNNFNNDYKNEMAHPSMKLANSFNSFNSNHDFKSRSKAPLLLNRPFNGPTPPVVSRGIFSAPAVPPRLCGLLRDRGMNKEVTPLSVLEKIMIQKLTPAYSKGFNLSKKGAPPSPLPPPTIASNLWRVISIKGRLYLIQAGTGGVTYQFVERNFGDWAPLEEVLQACANIP